MSLPINDPSGEIEDEELTLPAPEFTNWATEPALEVGSEEFNHANFISFLGICQALGIDLLPITWDGRLEKIGQGGQASIRQSYVNAKKSFAFRQLSPNDGDTITKDSRPKAFRTLINEATILRNTMLRINPSTIQLEGVCWAISHNGDVWPVFIFEKSSDGDLKKALGMRRCPAQLLDTVKLMWRDVAYAVLALHTLNVVHGDIKPENIMAYFDEGAPVKLADFGYATHYTEFNTLAKLPFSPPFTAPEHSHRHFNMGQAKKMDIYSLGMVLLWLLFRDSWTELPSNISKSYDTSIAKAHHERSDQFGDMVEFALSKLNNRDDFPQEDKAKFGLVFTKTLAYDPLHRASDIKELIQTLTDEDVNLPMNDDTQIDFSLDSHQDFQIAESFGLIHLDYRVREHVVSCLAEMAENSKCPKCKSNAAYQMAFCTGIGFGTRRDLEKSHFWLNESGHSSIEELIEATRVDKGAYTNDVMNELAESGFLGKEDLLHSYRKTGREEQNLLRLREEVEDFEGALGRHWALSFLKNILAFWLLERGNYAEAELLYRERKNEVESNEDSLESSRIIVCVNLVACLVPQGKLPEADALLTSALDRWLTSAPENDPRSLNARGWLADIAAARGDFALAEDITQDISNLQLSVLGKDNPNLVISQANLLHKLLDAGKWKEAEDIGLALWNDLKALLRYDDADYLTNPDYLSAMFEVIQSLRLLDKNVVAADECERLLDISERHLGVAAPVTVSLKIELVNIYVVQGRYKKSLALAKSAVDAAEGNFGRQHPIVIKSLATYGQALLFVSRPSEAEHAYRTVLSSHPSGTAPSFLALTKWQEGLASSLLHQGKYNEAEQIASEVVESRTARLGHEHPETLNCVRTYAYVLHAQSRLLEAEEQYRRVIKGQINILGKGHSRTLSTSRSLAGVLDLLAKHEEAQSILQDVSHRQEELLGVNHPDTLCSKSKLAYTMTYTNLKEARALIEDVVESCRATIDADHSRMLEVLGTFAYIQAKTGDFAAAEVSWRSVLAGYTDFHGSEHPLTIASMEGLASCMSDQGGVKNKEAIELFETSLPLSTKVLGEMHLDTIISRHNLATAFWKDNQVQRAKELNDSAYTMLSQSVGDAHPITIECRQLGVAICRHLDKSL